MKFPMSKCVIATIFLLAFLAASPMVLAQDEEPNTGWTGKGEFGLVKTSGNTETESLILGIEFVKVSCV